MNNKNTQNDKRIKEAQREYAEISERYNEIVTESDDRRYLFVPTILANLPDLHGKSVIDLASGEGYWARLMKGLGANRVTAIDISPEMVSIGIEKELNDPVGVDFEQGDACDFLLDNQSDLIFAAFLLHYAETKEELNRMCQSIAKNLNAGGEFISLNTNPDKPSFDGRKYFCQVQTEETGSDIPEEGSRIIITIYDKNGKIQPFQFHHRYWKKSTYEEALTSAGFKDISWQNLTVSQEGINNFPPRYWDEYIKTSNPCLLKCKKLV